MNPFRRKRSLGLEGFLWLGLFVAAHTALPSLQQIFDLACRLPQTIIPLSFVSVSAFCQYRSSFPLKTLLYIWRSLAMRLYQLFPPETIRWKGFRLWAVDGTALNLPEALWSHFGALRGARGVGPAQSHLMVLYDLVTRFPVACRAGKAESNAHERPLLKRLLGRLKAGDLLIIDSGLYSFEIFTMLIHQGVNFLIPMRAYGAPKLLRRFRKHDGLFQLKPSPYLLKNIPSLPEIMTVRIITVARPGFRPKRLVTSLLDPLSYSAEEIAQLYYERWHVETFFREFKHTLNVTSWHAHTLHAFYTELIFQMLLVTVTRLAMAEASVKDGRLPGQLSFSRCLAEVKHALAIMVHLPIRNWIKVYHELLIRLRCYIIDVRPGRRFERDRQKRRRQSRLHRLNNLKKEGKHVA